MTEPSIRYEHIGVGDITLSPYAQQFDLLPIVSEALESQLYIGLTDELNLQAESALSAAVSNSCSCPRRACPCAWRSRSGSFFFLPPGLCAVKACGCDVP